MQRDFKYVGQISDQLKEISSEIRILRNIAWPQSTKDEFFRYDAKRIPVVEYAGFNPELVIARLKNVRQQLVDHNDPIESWLHRIADKLEHSALLLATRGTKDFLLHSQFLYGKPNDSLNTSNGSSLDLAKRFNNMFHSLKDSDLGAPPEACILAKSLADEMRAVVKTNFEEYAPEIILDSNLASNALAGRRRVSIRPSACFSDKDVNQLIHHELFVHVATSINGYLQKELRILGEAHAGTTKTQEGLAVFAEFITGTVDLDRVRRLSDRVIAIQMAIDGADFLDVYAYYLEISDNPDQSFESAKRVFRGGVLTGGIPFTKDIVYLEGLLQVHNFLHVAISKKKFDYLNLLFVGKLDIDDLAVLQQLKEVGLIREPRFLPPWIRDKRHLLAYLTYSSFLNSIDMNELVKSYEDKLL